MGYEAPDAYHQPEQFGLEIVGTISWDDEAYQFNFTVVWKDPKTGELFYATDSGCSCPSPFENYTEREKLTPIADFQAFHGWLTERVREVQADDYYTSEATKARVEGDMVRLLQKVREAGKQ